MPLIQEHWDLQLEQAAPFKFASFKLYTYASFRHCSQRRAYRAMDLRRDIRSGYEIENQGDRGGRGGDQLQEEDGRKVDDRLVAAKDQLDKGISHHSAIPDTRVQANLRHFAKRTEKDSLLS